MCGEQLLIKHLLQTPHRSAPPQRTILLFIFICCLVVVLVPTPPPPPLLHTISKFEVFIRVYDSMRGGSKEIHIALAFHLSVASMRLSITKIDCVSFLLVGQAGWQLLCGCGTCYAVHVIHVAIFEKSCVCTSNATGIRRRHIHYTRRIIWFGVMPHSNDM